MQCKNINFAEICYWMLNLGLQVNMQFKNFMIVTVKG